jgi:hypothetical protein
MRPVVVLIVSSICIVPGRVAAQSHDGHRQRSAAHDDSAFRAMQSRGQGVMGVDQNTSIHHFTSLPDGGRIELQRDRDDSAGTAAIRAHLRTIAKAFADGDFGAPFAVHQDSVPGVPVMRRRRSAIGYAVTDLPRGAELRIRTADPAAVDAIHRFLAYQRREHRTEQAPHAH